ncbi:hypothetical protein BCR37DRAFT_408073 [Protomyces lactucae-debilis]|uniref:Uncharacterized protein n=1 Tax=Protomyces lactucae-debilis TaxID=2754530 RepID=A0A1Y2FK28_PROLT|nr:uncharacterized protein BCR37DRAFT_408073 [Protomyces lactucae-debilis]ORY84289.1 hypothetical protein BCR37DRAFT_408073 [Protomyces lactucae-debilis]
MDSYHLDYMSLAMRKFSDRTLLAIFIWLVIANCSLAQDRCRQIAMRATKTFQSPYCGTDADRAKFCAQGCSRRIADYIYGQARTPADVCSFVNPAFEWDLRFQNIHSMDALPSNLGISDEGCSQSTSIVCMCVVDVMLQRTAVDGQVLQQPGWDVLLQAAMANDPWLCSPDRIAIRMIPIQFAGQPWYRRVVQQEAAEPGGRSDEGLWLLYPHVPERAYEQINCGAEFSSAFADLIQADSGSCTIKRPDSNNGARGTLGIKCFDGPGMNDLVERLQMLYGADPATAPAQGMSFIHVRDRYARIAGEVYLEIGLGQDLAFVEGQQMGNYMAGYSVLAPEVLAYFEQPYR